MFLRSKASVSFRKLLIAISMYLCFSACAPAQQYNYSLVSVVQYFDHGMAIGNSQTLDIQFPRCMLLSKGGRTLYLGSWNVLSAKGIISAYRIDAHGHLVWQGSEEHNELNLVSDIVKSPDGRFVIAGAENRLIVFATESDDSLMKRHTHLISELIDIQSPTPEGVESLTEHPYEHYIYAFIRTSVSENATIALLYLDESGTLNYSMIDHGYDKSCTLSGYFNGVIHPSGDYFYVLSGTSIYVNRIAGSGSLSLLRRYRHEETLFEVQLDMDCLRNLEIDKAGEHLYALVSNDVILDFTIGDDGLFSNVSVNRLYPEQGVVDLTLTPDAKAVFVALDGASQASNTDQQFLAVSQVGQDGQLRDWQYFSASDSKFANLVQGIFPLLLDISGKYLFAASFFSLDSPYIPYRLISFRTIPFDSRNFSSFEEDCNDKTQNLTQALIQLDPEIAFINRKVQQTGSQLNEAQNLLNQAAAQQEELKQHYTHLSEKGSHEIAINEEKLAVLINKASEVASMLNQNEQELTEKQAELENQNRPQKSGSADLSGSAVFLWLIPAIHISRHLLHRVGGESMQW